MTNIEIEMDTVLEYASETAVKIANLKNNKQKIHISDIDISDFVNKNGINPIVSLIYATILTREEIGRIAPEKYIMYEVVDKLLIETIFYPESLMTKDMLIDEAVSKLKTIKSQEDMIAEFSKPEMRTIIGLMFYMSTITLMHINMF